MPQRDPRAAQLPVPIQPPADPSKVKATYELNGARVPITEGEYYDAYQRLQKLEPKTAGRAIDANRVFEHILAYAEAKALGLEPTPEEVALFDPLAANAALAEQVRARHEREGVTPELYATYQREARAIQKIKDLFANNMRTLSADVFENYRKDHYSVRLDYVTFDAAKYAEELSATPPTDDQLRAFWAEDKVVQSAHLLQSTVSAEFVSFDPRASSPSNGSARPVTREEALAFYNQNKARLDGMLTAEQRALLYPTEKADVAGLSTPFQMLRPIIDREIQLSGTIRDAFAQAKNPGADFEAIAKANGLTYEKIEKVDRETMHTKHGRYGPQIFSILMAANPGSVSPDLRLEPQLHYFYRLTDKTAARLPEFETVKAKLVEPYVETKALSRAQGDAQAMRTWIDQQIEEAVRTQEAALLKAADEAAEAEAKSRGVTQAEEIEKIRSRHKAQAGAEIRQKRDSLAAGFFDAYVKKHDLKVTDTGLFEVGVPRRGMSSELEPLLRTFVKNLPQIRTMEPGQVTQVFTDSATKTHLIAKMTERTQPDYSNMSESEILAMRSQTERASQYKPVQRWLYAEISKRRDLRMQ